MNVSKEQLIRDMEDLFGPERVLKTDLERLTYTYDSSFVSQQKEYLPDVVVCLNSTESVSRLMKYAYDMKYQLLRVGRKRQTGGSVPLWKA